MGGMVSFTLPVIMLSDNPTGNGNHELAACFLFDLAAYEAL